MLCTNGISRRQRTWNSTGFLWEFQTHWINSPLSAPQMEKYILIEIVGFLKAKNLHEGLCYIFLNRHLLVQSQQWNPQNNVWNLFKINSKDTRTTSLNTLNTLTQMAFDLFLHYTRSRVASRNCISLRCSKAYEENTLMYVLLFL